MPETVNKAALVKAIASKTEMTQKEAGEALDAVMDAIAESVHSGKKVMLVGFGSFEVAHRAERQGHNPKTGEPLTIAATNVVKFSAGEQLKQLVNS